MNCYCFRINLFQEMLRLFHAENMLLLGMMLSNLHAKYLFINGPITTRRIDPERLSILIYTATSNSKSLELKQGIIFD